MRTTLLILAIFLATLMNGILLYELPIFNRSSIAGEIAINSDKTPDLNAPKIKTDAKESQIDTQVTTYVFPYTYSRWQYKKWQPLRNLVRYHHNKKVERTSFWCYVLM